MADIYATQVVPAAASGLLPAGHGTNTTTATGLVSMGGDAGLFLNASGQIVTAAGALLLNTAAAQTLTGAGAVNLTSETTYLVTTGANALTLAAGTTGQRKIIVMKTDGGDGTLTPSSLVGGTTLTFNDAGDSVVLSYNGAAWAVVSNNGATLA